MEILLISIQRLAAPGRSTAIFQLLWETQRLLSGAQSNRRRLLSGEGDAEALGKLLRRLELTAEANDRDPKTIEISAIFGAQMMDPQQGGRWRLLALIAHGSSFLLCGTRGISNLENSLNKLCQLREMTETG